MFQVSNQNCFTENSVKVLDRNEEEIRKEMCRIFMEDDDFDIYMKEQIEKGKPKHQANNLD